MTRLPNQPAALNFLSNWAAALPLLGSLVLASLLSACGPAANPATAPTGTMETTAVRAPELSSTAPPEPSAWLLGYGDEGLTIYHPVTGERRDLALPPLWRPDVDLRDIPDNGLAAVRIASDLSPTDGLDLAILRLPEGEIIRRIPLLSTEFLGWLRETGESGQVEYGLEDARAAIDGRWFRPHWSPDGRSLAFAAVQDGDSADVYLYEVLRDEVHRLSDEPEQAVVLGWSPDGEWVLYSEAYGFEDDEFGYFPIMVRAVSTRSGERRDLFEPISGLRIAVVGWLSASEVALVAVDDYVEELIELVSADLNSGEIKILYDGILRSVALDPQSGALALNLVADPALGDGMAIMRPGEAPTAVADPLGAQSWGVVGWIPELGRFFAESQAAALAFTPDGAPAGIFDSEGCLPIPSPDGRWLAFGPCQAGWFARAGLRVYTPAGELVAEVEQDLVEAAVWEPESEGLHYLMYEEDGLVLKRAEIPGGATRVIDPDPHPSLALVQAAEAGQEVVRSLPTEAPTTTPAATPAPNPTPVRALNPSGPWLMGITQRGPVALNPDGTGLTELFAEAAIDRSKGWLNSEISSTGWVAAVAEGMEGAPWMLVIGRPPLGVVKQIPVLSPELAAEIDQPGEGGWRKRWTEDVYLALDADGFIDTLAWSPDGRLLAYVAAVDGPSADLYVYDTVKDEIRRLTDGPNQPKLLGWSADGRWVLHLEITDIQLGDGVWWDTLGLWAAASDGSEARRVPGVEGPVLLLDWGTPTRFMAVHYSHGPRPPFQIDLIDLEAGPVKTLYPGSTYQWAVDPKSGTLAFLVDPWVDPETAGLQSGMYVASPSRPAPKLVVSTNLDLETPTEQPYLAITAGPVWSAALDAFLIADSDGIASLVSSAGEIVRRIEGKCSLPLPSPDGRWLAYESCSRTPSSIEVHSEEDGRVLELSLGPVDDFFWAPDSGGIYYFQGRDPAQLWYVPVPEGAAQLIHPDSGLQGGWWAPKFVEGP